MTSKRVEDNIESGLSYDDGDTYWTAEKSFDGKSYTLTQSWLEPMSDWDYFDTLEELEAAMKRVQSDSQEWRI